jgi:hypothetical protein
MNNIINKIAQMERNAAEIQGVELAKHEVELALVDDVQNLYNIANKSYKANTDSLNRIAKQLESEFQKTADEYKKALDKYNQLEKMSKDLGVPLPNEISKLKGLIEFGLNDSLQSKKNAVNVIAI